MCSRNQTHSNKSHLGKHGVGLRTHVETAGIAKTRGAQPGCRMRLEGTIQSWIIQERSRYVQWVVINSGRWLMYFWKCNHWQMLKQNYCLPGLYLTLKLDWLEYLTSKHPDEPNVPAHENRYHCRETEGQSCTFISPDNVFVSIANVESCLLLDISVRSFLQKLGSVELPP